MSALLAPALASNVIPMPDERFGGLGAVQVVGLVLCFVIPLIGWALLARQVGRFVSLYRLGQPDAGRTGAPLTRTWVLTKEFLGHTRMSRLKVVAAAHWFTALSFIILFATLVNAFFQLVQPDYRLPLIGHFPPFEWLIEVFAWGGFIGIVVLVAIRQRNHPRSAAGDRRAPVALLRVDLLAGLLRRGDDLLRHDLHPAAARPRGRHGRPSSSRRPRSSRTSRSPGGWPASGRGCRCRRSRPGSTSSRR